MTTVAYDGESMSADTRVVGSYIDQFHCDKVYKIGKSLVGVAGQNQQWQIFLRWFKDQSKPKPDPKILDDFEALIVRDGKAFIMNDLCEPVEIGCPAAIGSGGDYAMAAMLGGADSRKAVQIAMKLDPNTGGKVKTVKV